MTTQRTTMNARAVIWAFFAVLLSGAYFTANSQSTDQAYPTAITENQVSGRINARDIGDSRLTTYYYVFNGRQGDLFFNVVTKNMNGSIDIFSMEGLRPLTKIVVYADLAQSETGRVIYLRQPQKLMLRVEGRTPNDDPAEFQMKFAGSFEAAIPSADEPPVPKVSDAAIATDSGIRVNSVGTIVEVKPKPTPKAEKAVAQNETEKAETKAAKPETAEEKEEKAADVAEKPSEAEKAVEEAAPKAAEKNRVVVKRPAASADRRNRRRAAPPVKATETDAKAEISVAEKAAETEAKPDETPAEKAGTEPSETRRPPKVVITDNIPKSATNPLANVQLVIVFKDGRKVERPMTEVIRFTADQTTLTVVSKNGRVSKFSILDVASVTIQ